MPVGLSQHTLPVGTQQCGASNGTAPLTASGHSHADYRNTTTTLGEYTPTLLYVTDYHDYQLQTQGLFLFPTLGMKFWYTQYIHCLKP